MVSSTSSSSPNAASKARAAPASPPCWARPIPARPISRSSGWSRIRAGMIGLPLRLLAREVYNKVVDKVGVEAVALITGEEKIKPPNPRFWVSTVEAMPRDLDVAFLAIDEIQLGADFERGHVFTDRMLNPPRPRGDAGARRRHDAADGREAPARRQYRQPAAPVAADLRRARRRSPGCRAAPPSSRSRPRRFTPSPS